MIALDDWRRRAVCRGMDIGIFYNCMSSTDRDKAKKICADCPVRIMCLEAALAEEADDKAPKQNLKGRHGVRGGLSASERWALAYPEAADEALDQEARRTRGRPSRVAEELTA